ncbi:sigma-54-dependent transcriptional regulator [Desulforhabdus amnigena]|uniref:Sigma-54-dependent Fis family transcriptional regulator n=1 Tax=Desulforhabdus amnigena TaxID=40218 RepID=A0A9W6D267_9BACT|nr:sigma-54 dependent transcriptional regulator [Desulforhabdus amnigena]GLI33594.1 sigma-54-dependent Fis family transcriptional regulator [Desulforhabdus amnigena]
MVVLIVENDPIETRMLADCVREQGHVPVVLDAVGPALHYIGKESPDLVLINLNGSAVSGLKIIEAVRGRQYAIPVIAMTHKGRLEDAVQLMKSGAHDFWVKPIPRQKLVKTLELLESKTIHSISKPPIKHSLLLTQNPNMIHLKTIAKKVALSKATVFIQGESGTGKELFARYIHWHSDRKNKPFVAVNCAALPENLLESELFGYEKGAFTGAIKSKEGKFELANQGTLLLDEVTEISVQLQAKLLRVLQENEVDRLGGKYPIPIDVRVIATTNAAMEGALAGGQFRRDLYYRLNVIPLKIPPLRSRLEDVELLSKHFVQKYSGMYNVPVEGIASDALEKLRGHSWPGNVRELENVIQRGVLLTHGKVLNAESVIFDHETQVQTSSHMDMELMTIGEMEKRLIHKTLDAVNDNRTRAAEILGISVRTLRNKLNEYRQNQMMGEGLESI